LTLKHSKTDRQWGHNHGKSRDELGGSEVDGNTSPHGIAQKMELTMKMGKSVDHAEVITLPLFINGSESLLGMSEVGGPIKPRSY